MKLKDLTGKRFGKLTVIKRIENNKWNETVWLCRCDCGNETKVNYGKLAYGHTRSCGCYAIELFANNVTRHKLRNHRLYTIYSGMKQRCYNPKSTFYYCYGGRGIRIDEEWLEDFKKFYDWAMGNGYNEKLTIDRINNNGDYSPQNCRWVDMSTQAINRRTNKIIEINGEKKCLSEWLKKECVSRTTFYRRIKQGWQVNEAITTPTKKYKVKRQV